MELFPGHFFAWRCVSWAVRTVSKSYEPVFGGIVAFVAAVLLCLLLSDAHSPSGWLMAYCVSGIIWGVLQVLGYREAKKRGIKIAEPTMGTAVGCVFSGLLLALVAALLFEFARNPAYYIATGIAAALLLCVGAVVGIRQRIWRSD